MSPIAPEKQVHAFELEEEQDGGAAAVEAVIEQVERLYRTITGRDPGSLEHRTHAQIPPEVDPVRHVEEQLLRLLELLPGAGRAPRTDPPRTPPITVLEAPGELVIAVDLPGVAPGTVQVSVAGQELEVRGERPRSRRTGALAWAEVRPGPFSRRLLLPPHAQVDAAQAELRDGVLELRIPLRAGPSTPRTIAVR